MSTLDGQTIGFIGLGFMGKPMARNLKAADATMVIHNRSQGVIEELSSQRMVDGTFEPGAKSTIQRKDLNQAVELAAYLGFELPATVLGRDLYDKLIDAGFGDLDHSALIKAIDPD